MRESIEGLNHRPSGPWRWFKMAFRYTCCHRLPWRLSYHLLKGMKDNLGQPGAPPSSVMNRERCVTSQVTVNKAETYDRLTVCWVPFCVSYTY